MTTYVEAKVAAKKLYDQLGGHGGIAIGITGTKVKGHRIAVRLRDEADVDKIPVEVDGVAVDTRIIGVVTPQKQ